MYIHMYLNLYVHIYIYMYILIYIHMYIYVTISTLELPFKAKPFRLWNRLTRRNHFDFGIATQGEAVSAFESPFEAKQFRFWRMGTPASRPLLGLDEPAKVTSMSTARVRIQPEACIALKPFFSIPSSASNTFPLIY